MGNETTWTPYGEKMMEQLQGLGPAESDSLVPAAGGGSIKALSAEKIEKIGIAEFTADGGVHYGMCTVIAEADYVLPIFFSRWEEREGEINFTVDVMPTVDTLVDEAYRVKYIEPMGEYWDKFGKLAGTRPEEDDELRSVCSIIYTSGKMPIEKEGMRLAALAPHTQYLKSYAAYVQAAEQGADSAKLCEVQRKTARVREVLKSYARKMLAGPAGTAVGKENEEKLLSILF